MRPGIHEGLADVDLAHALRWLVATLQHVVDHAVVEADATEEVLLRVGGRHRHEVALDLEHHRFFSTCAAAASDADSGGASSAAAHAGMVTL